MAPSETRGPGLHALAAMLAAGVLAAGALLVQFAYAPWLAARVASETDVLVAATLDEATEARKEDLLRTEEVVRAGAAHVSGRIRRDLEDLPFELVAGDPEKTRALVSSTAEAAAAASAENARVLAAEVRRRAGERLARLEASLRGRQEAAARAAAASVSLSSSLLVAGLLATLVGAQAFLLHRTVVRPVARIAAGAERLAAGELGHRVEERGGAEVAGLAVAVNRMAGARQSAEADLRALQADLERRVEEKSAALARSETLASLGTLAGGVAHEFNNLLGGILGTVEDAAEDAKEPPVREALDLVARTARRGCRITEGLLRFARPPAPRTEPVDAAAILRDAAALARAEAQRKGVTVEVTGEARPLPADPGGLHQVVLNLLANAVHFAPAGGRVEASVADEGESVVLRVRDSGPGIAAEHLPRLFEPFFTTRGSDGTGLGLAVSHGIVRSHGGSIEAANRPGGGAEFTVRLPAPPARPREGT
jgi:two-component system NtrC family sensor kinase